MGKKRQKITYNSFPNLTLVNKNLLTNQHSTINYNNNNNNNNQSTDNRETNCNDTPDKKLHSINSKLNDKNTKSKNKNQQQKKYDEKGRDKETEPKEKQIIKITDNNLDETAKQNNTQNSISTKVIESQNYKANASVEYNMLNPEIKNQNDEVSEHDNACIENESENDEYYDTLDEKDNLIISETQQFVIVNGIHGQNKREYIERDIEQCRENHEERLNAFNDGQHLDENTSGNGDENDETKIENDNLTISINEIGIQTEEQFVFNNWIHSQNKREFIEMDIEKKQPFGILSCQFVHPEIKNQTVYIRKQDVDYLLIINGKGDNFIATIKLVSAKELKSKNFFNDVSAKGRFLSNGILINEIVKYKAWENRNYSLQHLLDTVQKISDETSGCSQSAEDVLELYTDLEKQARSNSRTLNKVLSNICNGHYSVCLKSAAKSLWDIEMQLLREAEYLPRFENHLKNDTNEIMKSIKQILHNGINRHRQALYECCSDSFYVINYLQKISKELILRLNRNDLQLFLDLKNYSNQNFSNVFLDNLLKTFFDNFWKYPNTKNVIYFINPIFSYLYKSFVDLIEEISVDVKLSSDEIFAIVQNEEGKKQLSTSFLFSAFETQCRFIFTLMMHFTPGAKVSKYQYEYKIFKNKKNIWTRIYNFFRGDNDNKNLENLPIERSVWLYILDDVIHRKMYEKFKECSKLFEPLLIGFISFVVETREDSFEAFRVVMHNVTKFLGKTIPYFSANNSCQSDLEILNKQIDQIERIANDLKSNSRGFENFRDMIQEFNQYWDLRETIVENVSLKAHFDHFRPEMGNISKELLHIVNTALSFNAQIQSFIRFFRLYNEFLSDFEKVDFTLYVKKSSVNADMTTELVKNKISDGNKATYKVLQMSNLHSCRHYVIEIIKTLIESLMEMLKKEKWSKGYELNDDDRLNATSSLLSAIRSSFNYLKEQPEYLSFDTFLIESTKPFDSVIKNSISFKDLDERLDTIKCSFWYIRRQNEIGIDEAIELYCQKSENSISIENFSTLKKCYGIYSEKYEFYIRKCLKMPEDDGIALIVGDIQKNLKPQLIQNWNATFKTEEIPSLLAGLSALWSIQESKDVFGLGQVLKPHCVQVLCLFVLLSIQDSRGTMVSKCLAQVLTGQGKSLILGLTSGLLALLGHPVRVVCYSKYLATRDQQKFLKFFRALGIHENITYGTFDDMAIECINLQKDGVKWDIRDLYKNTILNLPIPSLSQNDDIFDKSPVLLIDEVDVFFSPIFYGVTYNSCTTIQIQALASIQEHIWKIAQQNISEKIDIQKEVFDYVRERVSKLDEDFIKFEEFRLNPKEYFLLSDESNTLIKKRYTNKSLFDEQLKLMINNAEKISKGDDDSCYFNNFKIDDEGYITKKNSLGIYNKHALQEYFNIFNYFRLKRTKFDHKNLQNYGYLKISTGRISYANLPQKYKHIFGVSGTVMSMNDFETETITEKYGIRKLFSMPSFFGDCHLKFNEHIDFVILDDEDGWLNKIYSKSESVTRKGRSVLVFFKTDKEMNKFKSVYGGRFGRLNTLTENTTAEDVELLIQEAGVSKTVTLATRGVGRGVDFRSSVAVESCGGVHVIQSFFSLDVKEETQIKGRTARIDNKGSYELVLCRKSLIEDKLLQEDSPNDINYQALNASRIEKAKTSGEGIAKDIKNCDQKHSLTMECLHSFIK